MFIQFQNEIIATIAILTLIIIYLISRDKKSAPTNQQKVQKHPKKKLQKKQLTKVEEAVPLQETQEIPSFDTMQDEALLGSQEGNFDFNEEKNDKEIEKEKKALYKREVPQHGKITKQNFSEFSGKKILVAEDNFINQKVLTGLLAGSGIEVTLANDGQEALDILEKDSNFFIILMDAHMPILDGFEATKLIRKNPHYDHIAIVALSGDTAVDDIAKMKNAGMDETLEKPLRIDALYDIMYSYSGEEKKSNFIEVIMTTNLRGDNGLEVCGGDEHFYKEILKEFLDDYTTSAQRLHILLHEHRLKEADKFLLDILGITANIGAVLLNKTAQDIKLALSDTDTKTYLTLIEQYKNNLNLLITDIKDYI